MTAQDAYEALLAGMDESRPLCRGDNRFTDDDTNPDHVRELCVLCPLYGLCKNYAQTARPKAGIWAGQRWTGKETK
jgi:hypothetical protein